MSFSIISAVLVGLTFVAIMLVSGNNLSACVGPAIGSKIISKRFGIISRRIGFLCRSTITGCSDDKVHWGIAA